MSTTEAVVSTATAGAPATTYATLVRGRVYYLGNKEFLNGVAVAVSPAEREWLEANAVDMVSVENEAEYQSRAKFVFSETASAASRPAGRPRGRPVQ